MHSQQNKKFCNVKFTIFVICIVLVGEGSEAAFIWYDLKWQWTYKNLQPLYDTI
jgi:hypothetical protein